MRPISSERFVRILAKHRAWGALAKYALRMAEIDRLYLENAGKLVERARAEAAETESRRRLYVEANTPASLTAFARWFQRSR